MNRDYRVGEIVLMNYGGWLKAFRVIEVLKGMEGVMPTLEYRMEPVDGNWRRPVHD